MTLELWVSENSRKTLLFFWVYFLVLYTVLIFNTLKSSPVLHLYYIPYYKNNIPVFSKCLSCTLSVLYASSLGWIMKVHPLFMWGNGDLAKMKWHAETPMTKSWEIWDWNSGLLTSRYIFFTLIHTALEFS